MAVPTLVQHVGTGMDNQGAVAVTFQFPNFTLSGNCIIFGLQYNSVGSISSIVDNVGNTYVSEVSFTSATYSQKATLYVVAGAIAGVQSITVTFSGLNAQTPSSKVHAVIAEFYNIATSSPVDGTPVSSNSSVSPGSITTTSDGDLIFHWAMALSTSGIGGQFNGTSIASGSGFTLLGADLQVGSCDQYSIQSTHGSVSPTCTVSGSATWGSLAIALKSASAGMPPSPNTMRIVHLQSVTANPGNLIPLQFPSSGNLLVASLVMINPVTSITDNSGNTWSIPAATNISTNTPFGLFTTGIDYAANAITGPNLSGITFSPNLGAQMNLILYDIVNASPSPFGSGSTSFVNQESPGNLILSVTPVASNGIAFFVDSNADETINSVASPGILDVSYNSYTVTSTQTDYLNENNGLAHIYFTSNAPLTFNLGYSVIGYPNYVSMSAATFNAPPVGSVTQIVYDFGVVWELVGTSWYYWNGTTWVAGNSPLNAYTLSITGTPPNAELAVGLDAYAGFVRVTGTIPNVALSGNVVINALAGSALVTGSSPAVSLTLGGLSGVISVFGSAPNIQAILPVPPPLTVPSTGYYVILDMAGAYLAIYLEPNIDYGPTGRNLAILIVSGPYASYSAASLALTQYLASLEG